MGLLRRHKLLTATVAGLLAVLGVFLATGVAVWRAAHNDEARRIDHVDAIVVLGAAQYAGRPSPVFAGRLQQAELLYREHFAPLVLVLGGNQPGDITTEGEAGRLWLIEHGLPVAAVVAQPMGSTTLESLTDAAGFLHDHGLHSALLVSDPWHNLRIRRIARDLGIQAYVSATWHSAAKSQWTRLSGYTRETVAYLYYRIFHR